MVRRFEEGRLLGGSNSTVHHWDYFVSFFNKSHIVLAAHDSVFGLLWPSLT